VLDSAEREACLKQLKEGYEQSLYKPKISDSKFQNPPSFKEEVFRKTRIQMLSQRKRDFGNEAERQWSASIKKQ
jgi:hypothetical protein